MIINGDCLEELKNLPDDSVDTVITDPPYGYAFMGKSWDKAVPSVEIWQECLRVLKPGAFACVMSAPRSDVQQAMTERLIRAGFRLDFTPIYWTYASGFPKAGNIGKLVDKRLGVEREVVSGTSKPEEYAGKFDQRSSTERPRLGGAVTAQAKALDGSYAGFQPKPAVEVVIIAMKPLSEKTYVDQALKNGKGITWLDDCRVPLDPNAHKDMGTFRNAYKQGAKYDSTKGSVAFLGTETAPNVDAALKGRFPANLLVSDDVLNDGRIIKSTGPMKHDYREQNNNNHTRLTKNIQSGFHPNDSGSYSRYFDLDAWARERLPAEQAMTFPFAIFPKASKSEKNKGLDSFEERQTAGLPMRSAGGERGGKGGDGTSTDRLTTMKNHHPTVKPLRLMSYLITLFSREGDTVLDPFVGSGTTAVAAEQLGRRGIGIEREAEYAEIARARVEHAKTEDDTNNQLQLIE